MCACVCVVARVSYFWLYWSQPVNLFILWPEPHLLQPDDWFLFGAMPMGLIKSKCKLSLITNCKENASSHPPLRGRDLDYSDKLRSQWAFPELCSPAQHSWHSPRESQGNRGGYFCACIIPLELIIPSHPIHPNKKRNLNRGNFTEGRGLPDSLFLLSQKLWTAAPDIFKIYNEWVGVLMIVDF